MNMISSRIIACALISIASVVMAFEDFGPIETARREHPNIFVPEEVNVLDINSIPHYIFSGQAEKCFSEETDAELWEEATMSAKNIFYSHLSGEKENVKISMSGCEPLYRLRDGNLFTIILSVPQDKVEIMVEKIMSSATSVVDIAQKQEAHTSVIDFVSNGVTKTETQANKEQVKVLEKPILVAEQLVSSSKVVQSPNVDNQSEMQEASHDDIDLRIAKLRERLEANTDDWRLRRRLAKLFVAKGNVMDAVKLYDSAARGALKDRNVLDEERIEVVYETARACEVGLKMNLALKYYRMLLHMNIPFEIRKSANAKISNILLLNSDF